MKKAFIITGSIILIILIVAVVKFLPMYTMFMSIETQQIDPQCTLYLGGGSNSMILTAKDNSRAILVDSKMKKTAKKLKEAINSDHLTIINTHVHPDHIQGNILFPDATVISGPFAKAIWDTCAEGASYPDSTIQPGEAYIIRIDDEIVHVKNMGQSHTRHDVIVYLEKRKLLMTGDLIFRKIHPALFTETGTNVDMWISTLDSLYKNYEIETLVPGHGAVSDKKTLMETRNYFSSIRDAIGDQEKLAELKKKYKDYFAIPGLTSFKNTVEFIEENQER